MGPGVDTVQPGQKVLLSLTWCGACGACDDGHPAYCSTWLPCNLMGEMRAADSAGVGRGTEPVRNHFFGQSSFAEYAIADARSLVVVGDDVDLTVLAPLGCGVLTAFGSMWNVLDPGPRDTVVVHGAGAVGLSSVIAAALRSPAALVAVDIVEERLHLAREPGATHTVNATTEDVAARIVDITSGRGADLSFDTTVNPRVARGALDAAAAGGTVLVCGAPAPGTEIPVDIQGILTGKILRGVTMGDAIPSTLLPQLVALHADGRLSIEKLQARYTLDDINQAAADMHDGAAVKPVIVF